MKQIIRKSILLLLAVLFIISSVSFSAFAENELFSREQSADTGSEFFYTIRARASDNGKMEFQLFNNNDPDTAPIRVQDATFSYKANVTINVDASSLQSYGFGSAFELGLYENGIPLVRTSTDNKLSYTFHKVVSDRCISLRVLDSTGKPLTLFGEDYSIGLNMHVKDGFFDKFFSFFLELFGALPNEHWDIWWDPQE